MVKIRVECGENVDQRDQVLVFDQFFVIFVRSLKPDFSLSLGLGILTLFSCLSRLQVGACVGVLRQLSSWQGIRSKSLDRTLITYLAFVN